jgi:hypothetical protein
LAYSPWISDLILSRQISQSGSLMFLKVKKITGYLPIFPRYWEPALAMAREKNKPSGTGKKDNRIAPIDYFLDKKGFIDIIVVAGYYTFKRRGEDALPIRGKHRAPYCIFMFIQIGQEISFQVPEFGRAIIGNGHPAGPIFWRCGYNLRPWFESCGYRPGYRGIWCQASTTHN